MTVRALLAETLTTHDGTGVDHLFGLAADSTVARCARCKLQPGQ